MSEERYLPIDIMRGLTMAAMVLVNTPGNWGHVYSQLGHSAWHGCTIADLVFPSFLFVAGYSMAFSFSRNDMERKVRLARIGRRIALIFAAGLLINAYPFQTGLADIRIMGVLQRIALAWGLAAVGAVFIGRKGLSIISIGILLGYWAAIIMFGGNDPWSLEGNIARHVDILVIGERHMWNGFGIPFDPEGGISTLPAAVSVLAGYIAGGPASSEKTEDGKTGIMLFSGLILVVAGSAWGTIQPVSKPLWTGSYVLLASGISILLMALVIWITEVKGWRRWWWPISVFGTNPLLLFLFSALWVRTITGVIKFGSGGAGDDAGRVSLYNYLFDSVFRPLAGEMNGSLLFAVFHLGLYWSILYFLYRRKVFLKA
jgi:predicted acyltransferase